MNQVKKLFLFITFICMILTITPALAGIVGDPAEIEKILESLRKWGSDIRQECDKHGGKLVIMKNNNGTFSHACCKDGYGWNDTLNGFTEIIPYLCGCPAGTEEKQNEFDEHKVCCKNGMQLATYYVGGSPKNELVANSTCGCPEGGEPSQSEGRKDVCCKNNYSWSSYRDNYSGYWPYACDCPEGGSLTEYESFGENHVTCCKDGYEARESSEKRSFLEAYDLYTPGICGCPDGGKLTEYESFGNKTVTCCKEGFEYSREKKEYYDINVLACGCPSNASKVSVGDNSAVCCVDDKQMYSKDKLIISEVCGCPEGGEPSQSKERKDVCCKNNYSWSSYRKNYSGYWPYACGCPEGGSLTEYESFGENSLTCCKDGYEARESSEKRSFLEAYDLYTPGICGCPKGGNLVNEVCCKGTKIYDEKARDYLQVSDKCQVCSIDSVVCNKKTGECHPVTQSE